MLGGQLQDRGHRAVQLPGQAIQRLLALTGEDLDLTASPDSLSNINDFLALSLANVARAFLVAPSLSHPGPPKAVGAGVVADTDREIADAGRRQAFKQLATRVDRRMCQRDGGLEIVLKFDAEPVWVARFLCPSHPAIDRADLVDLAGPGDSEMSGRF